MAKNIQLELLAKFGQSITTKRIFLYEANPAEEPVYITISELAQQLNTLLGSGDVTLYQFIAQIGSLSAEVTKINKSISVIGTAQSTNAKVIGELQTSVSGLNSTVDKLIKDLSTNNGEISSIKNRLKNAEDGLSNLQSDASALQSALTKVQNDIKSGNDGVNASLEKLAWQKL